MLRFRLVFVSFFALAACDGGITSIDELTITVAVTPDHIVAGDTASIVVRITNPTRSRVEIPVRCTSPFEIANAQGEVVVGNEPLACLMYLAPPEVVGPFQSIERRTMWTGYRRTRNGSSWVTEPAAPGSYRVYGRLEGRRSAPEPIEVSAPGAQ